MSSYSYKFEEHICPYCEHKFVVQMIGSKYVLRGSDAKYILTSCPGCGNNLFVTSGAAHGVLAELVTEDEIIRHSLFID